MFPRKKSQRGRGRSSTRGKGKNDGRGMFQAQKEEYNSSHQ